MRGRKELWGLSPELPLRDHIKFYFKQYVFRMVAAVPDARCNMACYVVVSRKWIGK